MAKELTEKQIKDIDDIFNYILIRDQNNKGNRISPGSVKKIINVTMDEARYLLRYMVENITFNEDPILNRAESISGIIVTANYNTRKFVKAGGCQTWYANQLRIEQEEIEFGKMQNQKLKNDLEAFSLTKKQFYWTVIIAIAGFIMGAVGIILQLAG